MLKKLILSPVLFLIVLIGGGYAYWYKTAESPIAPAVSMRATEGGVLFLNLKSADGQSALYTFNTETNALLKSPLQAFTPSVSHDGQYVVGAAEVVGKEQGIYLYSVINQSSRFFSASHNTFPRLPQISPDNTRVVWNELTVAIASSTPGEWDIYLASATSSTARMIAHGMYPHWSPDGTSMLYLGDDGIHQRVISTSHDQLVWGMLGNSKAFASMMFTISKDFTQIAWADAERGTIIIARIDLWSPFNVTVTHHLENISAFWPIFSPSGRQIVFEQVDRIVHSTTSTSPSKPRLTLLDIQSMTSSNLLDLSPYDPMTISISDWVSNL